MKFSHVGLTLGYLAETSLSENVVSAKLETLATLKNLSRETKATIGTIRSDLKAIRTSATCEASLTEAEAICSSTCYPSVVIPTTPPSTTPKPITRPATTKPTTTTPTTTTPTTTTPTTTKPATTTPAATTPAPPLPDFPQILKDRCLKDEICAADDQDCLTDCANGWKKYCSVDGDIGNIHDCFYTTATSSEWETRDACFDDCRDSMWELETLLTDYSVATQAVSVVTTTKIIKGDGRWHKDYITDWVKGYCVKNHWCPEGNWDCYKKCANEIYWECGRGGKPYMHKWNKYGCFYEDNETLGSHETNNQCVEECIAEKVVNKKSMNYEARKYMPRWDLSQATANLKERCLTENICGPDDEICFEKCARVWISYCNSDAFNVRFSVNHFSCLYEKESLFTSPGSVSRHENRSDCLNKCQSNKEDLRDGLIRVMREFRGAAAQATFLTQAAVIPDFIGNSKDMSIEGIRRLVESRCVAAKICPETDNKECIKKCAEEYRYSCTGSQLDCFKKDTFDTYTNAEGTFEFQDRSACLDYCDSRNEIHRNRLTYVHKKFNKQTQINLPAYQESSFTIDGFWFDSAIYAYLRTRCVSKNLRPDNDRASTTCEWRYKQYAKKCFNEYNFNGFETREACIDDFEINNIHLRKALYGANSEHFDESQPALLLPSHLDEEIFKPKEEPVKPDEVFLELKTMVVDGRTNKWQRKIVNGVPQEWTRISGTDPLDADQQKTTTETKTVTYNDEDHIWERTNVGETIGEWTQTAGSHKFATPELAEAHFQKLVNQPKF